jgi:hypothetical protein
VRKKKPVAVQPLAEDNVVVLPHDQVDEDLTDIGRAARSGTNAALSRSNQFFHLYIRARSCKPDRCLGAFEIITVLHPFMKNLKFMNSINSTALDHNPATDDKWLHLHKERIKNFYVSLMTRSSSTMIAKESISILLHQRR